ncbi:MAG TPA: hypothetical protein VGE16_01900 [Albitalea sp.]
MPNSRLRTFTLTLAATYLSVAVGAAQAMVSKPPAQSNSSAKPAPAVKRVDFGRERPSRDARKVAQWALDSGDHQGEPFIIVDKVRARVYVFEASGKLRGAAPALLGFAKGDHTVPGIGDKKLSEIKPSERTTPAGRFVSEPGRNMRGEDIVWVDYDAAVSMHRVLTTNPAERRLQRLMSKTPKDNRISYGCINLPVAFYEKVLSPTVAKHEAVIYVLPESRPLSQVFGLRDGADKRRATARAGKPEAIQLHHLDGA